MLRRGCAQATAPFCSRAALIPQAEQQQELLGRQKPLGETGLGHKDSAQRPQKALGSTSPCVPQA